MKNCVHVGHRITSNFSGTTIFLTFIGVTSPDHHWEFPQSLEGCIHPVVSPGLSSIDDDPTSYNRFWGIRSHILSPRPLRAEDGWVK